MFYILLSILFFFLQYTLSAETNTYYYFKQITTRNGLPSTINTIYDDHNGFLWIGTNYGVYRFDGEKLNLLSLPIENSKPQILNIQGDQKRFTWIFTNYGIYRHCSHQNGVEQITKDKKPRLGFCLYTDPHATILPITDTLLFFNTDGEEYHSLPLKGETKSTLIHKIEKIESEAYLVLTSQKTIFKVNSKTGHLQPLNLAQENDISDFFIDSANRLWLCCYGKGVFCYDKNGNLLHVFDKENCHSGLGVVLDIEERDGSVWLATDGAGIFIIDTNTWKMSRIHTGNNRNFPANSVNYLQNGADNMWIGMVREGVLAAKENFITTYTKERDNRTSCGLSEKCPLCIYEEEDGTLWIGTDGGGVNAFLPDQEQFIQFPSTFGDKVVSICRYSSHELLISCFAKGIFIFDKNSGRCTPFIVGNETINQELVFSGFPINIYENGNDEIEFHGLHNYCYIRKNKTFVLPNDSKPQPVGSWIFIDKFHSKSFFHNQRAIFSYDAKNNQVDIVSPAVDKELILTCAIDENGIVWISRRSGITTLNLTTKQIDTIKSSNNQEIITSMVSDRDGTIWMGTIGSICAYTPKNNKFILYSESDGVLPNDFLAKPVLRARNGNIYMGGSMGLVRIDKALKQQDKSVMPKVALSELLLNGTSTAVSNSALTPTIEIPYDFSSLVIRTKLKHGDIFRKQIYRYKIEGLHGNEYISSRSEFVIQTLPYGNYSIMAQCMQSDGNWTPYFPILSVTVHPPWWLNIWFLCLVIITVIGGLLLFLNKREQSVKKRMKEHEREIYKEKVQALININHELRTPLTLLYLPLKQVLESRQLPLELKMKLLGVFKQVRQMKNLINMILNLRKMEVGQYTLKLTPIHFNRWLGDIVEDFRNEFSVRSLLLQFCPDTAIERVSCDSAQCEIIINNLLMNAYKFSRANGSILISTKLNEQAKLVTVEVHDEGIGIENENVDQLFNEFHQGNHEIQGSGIGLSYAKQLVEMHGGEIGAFSNESGGSTFFFTLPYSQSEQKMECPPKPYLNEFMSATSQFKSTHNRWEQCYQSVIIVEDDPDLCRFLAENLQQLFTTVYCACDGIEALPIIVSQLPQLIISDVLMPRMDGLELCQRIKQNEKLNYIPIILLTSKVDDRCMEQSYEAGANAYITKPFDMDILLTQIQNMMQNQNIIQNHCTVETILGKRIESEKSTPQNELFLVQLNQVIRENIDNCELNVNFIATSMGMSRASLYNKMKEVVGIGVNEYVSQIRIRYACELLENSDAVIREIAEKAGFTHPRNFSTLFKNIMGETPSDYRKKRQAAESVN